MTNLCIARVFLAAAILTAGLLCLNAVIFHTSPPQPEPTSQLITKIITLNSDINFAWYPGDNIEVVDTQGYGYHYHRWFESPPALLSFHTYEIRYYCDPNGVRQIYSYIDISKLNTEKDRCVYVNGVCQ